MIAGALQDQLACFVLCLQEDLIYPGPQGSEILFGQCCHFFHAGWSDTPFAQFIWYFVKSSWLYNCVFQGREKDLEKVTESYDLPEEGLKWFRWGLAWLFILILIVMVSNDLIQVELIFVFVDTWLGGTHERSPTSSTPATWSGTILTRWCRTSTRYYGIEVLIS